MCLDFFAIFIHELRLEQSAVAREATLLTERQGKDALSKALAEAQGRIEGLLKEIYSANRKTDQLQNTIERFVVLLSENHLHTLCLHASAWQFLTAKERSHTLITGVVSGHA